jgi:biopolymer transport protein ExbD
MARRTSIKPLQEISEINMTPLIDLTFLLLITFIIIMPMVEQGIPVNLPKGKAKELDQSHMQSITVDVKGQVYLNTNPITLDQLRSEMTAVGAGDPETTVMVRGDQGVPYGKVIDVMRILQDAQISKMALVTTPEQPARR